jgi:hypothetical protein
MGLMKNTYSRQVLKMAQIKWKAKADIEKENAFLEISLLKAQLAETDYKVIKCYEYQIAGLELPYNIEVLHSERQAIRNKINELGIAE